MVSGLQIVWSVPAKETLKEIFRFIKSDSLQNAEMVTRGIAKAVSSLNGPVVHRPDKYKRNNDGTYRVFEM